MVQRSCVPWPLHPKTSPNRLHLTNFCTDCRGSNRLDAASIRRFGTQRPDVAAQYRREVSALRTIWSLALWESRPGTRPWQHRRRRGRERSEYAQLRASRWRSTGKGGATQAPAKAKKTARATRPQAGRAGETMMRASRANRVVKAESVQDVG